MDKENSAPLGVRIISKDECKYCRMAKELMQEKGIPYQDTKWDKADEDYIEKRDAMIEKTNGHNTFPWIFVGEEFVGGYTDLLNAYNSQKLHAMCEKIGITLQASMTFDEPDF
jgi:glutaredoxin 3